MKDGDPIFYLTARVCLNLVPPTVSNYHILMLVSRVVLNSLHLDKICAEIAWATVDVDLKGNWAPRFENGHKFVLFGLVCCHYHNHIDICQDNCIPLNSVKILIFEFLRNNLSTAPILLAVTIAFFYLRRVVTSFYWLYRRIGFVFASGEGQNQKF